MEKSINFLKSHSGSVVHFTFVVMLSLLLFTPLNAFAADLAASGKTTIKDTFGSGSTVMYTLYVLEILSGIFLYIKTKNLAVFGGIVAVLIFTTVAFGLFT
ncbi:type IV conjugative transfer system pilin TraA [Glaesserella parasuis]|nr:type IV conjugative transfer system pilin TraA [Glaesserella parasuis]MCT8760490.1 hypothetical protein [Glaesserella parasuis]MCT8766572.1 hypothetical protein [Glaesserella parasuis]MDG6261604.1 type IV conjugative transfer system pilin TraA [Glaesserella parasuis]MDG6280368.1 type IV conjugative transfer system pilin TraA [Glaesserella parasuis]MDG6307826.1 type IV conjugative transfer system pilin TraA [Glaesserella parasuis]